MDIDFIKKYETRAPRYTSYPPANFFNESVNNNVYIEQLKASNYQGAKQVSIYIHIPFCPKVCNFCGCTTFLNTDTNVINRYVDALEKEIDKVVSYIDSSRPVTQLHWGGGTPNALDYKYIERIVRHLKKYFTFSSDAEIAMECNPAYMDIDDINKYRKLGFNRLSIGVQDFDLDVLKTINRSQSKLPIKELVETMHNLGMKGINLDLVYGLPGQTVESFKDAVAKAVDSGADRIVTFSYAHVPWVKTAQKVLEAKGLPTSDQKLAMFVAANEYLTNNGYVFIGMDHYTKPDDSLAIALKNGLLKRNFQGYCTTQTTGQVYAFGCSGISQLFGSYVQNIKNPLQYMQSVENCGLAVQRGYLLDNNQIIVREAIDEVMCNLTLDFNACAKKLGVSPQKVAQAVGWNTSKFVRYVDDGILEVSDNGLKLKQEAIMAVRNIAVLLDPLSAEGKMFSKTI